MNIDHNTENQTCVLKSDKMNSEILIQKKPNDHHFFEIKFTSGSVPDELSGRYSSIPAGIKAVEQYLNNKRPTAAVRRDKVTEERKKRNGSKNRTEGSQHIREGSDN